MSQQNSSEILKNFQLPQISIPAEAIRQINTVFTQLQKTGTAFAEKLSYFEANEVVQLSQKFNQAQRLMQPLADLYPQLDKLNRAFQNLHIPEIKIASTANSVESEPVAKVDNEICNATEVLVNKALEHGLVQDEIPDESVIQEVIFVIAYYLTTMNHRDMLNWVMQLPELALTQIRLAGNLTTSGIFNAWTILIISQWICDFLRSIL